MQMLAEDERIWAGKCLSVRAEQSEAIANSASDLVLESNR